MNFLTNKYLKILKEKEKSCVDCGAINSIFCVESEGILVWKACGLVLENNLYFRNDQCKYSSSSSKSKDDYSRAGGTINTNFDHCGMLEKITGDVNTKLITGCNRLNWNSEDKYKSSWWSIICELGATLRIPKSVQEDAMNLLVKALEYDEFKETNRYLMSASVLLIASGASKYQKGLKVFLRETEIKKKALSRCYRHIKRVVWPRQVFYLKPDSCVTQISNKLNMNCKNEEEWKVTAKYFSTYGILEGKNPYTIAGVAIYMTEKTI